MKKKLAYVESLLNEDNKKNAIKKAFVQLNGTEIIDIKNIIAISSPD